MRIALTSYRSKPHSGGQGVYVRNLSRELVALGHTVEVFSGQPYPVLDPGVRLTAVPSLDLYRDDDPFRRPALREFRTAIDVAEYAIMCSGGFPEPRTFSWRLLRVLRSRLGQFDIVHDNQTLGPGLLKLADLGVPVVTTIHHPISRDRRIDLQAARGWRRLTVRRWYGFVAMQKAVARRSATILTVSQNSAQDIGSDFGVPRGRIRVIPVGVDARVFRPGPDKVPGRIVAVASADVPLKGLPVLFSALAEMPAARLTVVGTAGERTRARLGPVADRVSFVSGLDDRSLAALLASAELVVVPSLYEGFSLPAIEAMACGTPVVAAAVGALPELVGADGRCGALVPAGDPGALAAAVNRLLAAPDLRRRMGQAAHQRALDRYSWATVAAATAALYEELVPGRTTGEQAAA